MFYLLSPLKIISLNVSLPKTVEFKGHKVSTGIYKEPVQGKIKLRKLNLDGDQQADLTVHGGPDKAVYAFPSESYSYWKNQYPDIDMKWGMFGENFTTEGLFEDEANIGDEYEVGTAKLAVTQPRMPCFKLGIRFGKGDVIKKFFAHQKSGIYFKVLEEGEVQVGDEIRLVKKDDNNVTVQDVMRTYGEEKNHLELIKRAIKINALPEGWRSYYQEILVSGNEK